MLSKKLLAAMAASLCSSIVLAQVPTAASPSVAVDTFESIGTLQDLDAFTTGSGQVARRVYTVPPGRVARLTDLSVDPRNANTTVNPCFFEVWRGNDVAATSLAWTRARIFSTATYDRSWVTGPQFNAGESIWIVGRFDPLNAGLRICSRNDTTLPSELRYGLRGYVARQFNP